MTDPTIATPPFVATSTVGRVPTLGFGTAVAMWVLAYLAFMGPGLLAGELIFGMMLIAIGIGGAIAGAIGGVRLAVRAGAMSALVNMLLIGSLFGRETPIVAALGWVAGLWIVSIAVAAIGGVVGARHARGRPLPWSVTVHWPGAFAVVALVTVFLLLITGGLVTGLEAGLAVTDWPNTFGHNMLLYPLSEMEGGVYYEHAHRLYGMLVGLTTLTLTWVTWRSDRRVSSRVLITLILVMVCVQGLMGGLRVTGHLTLSTSPEDMRPSTTLAIVHGVFGQVVFGSMALLTALLSRSWIALSAPMIDGGAGSVRRKSHPSAGTDQALSALLVLALVVQLVLGACYRHLQDGTQPAWALHGHLTMAAVVLALAILVGLRAWGAHGDVSILRRLGIALVVLVSIQVVLGIAALVAVLVTSEGPVRIGEVVITTAHQATGAALLGTAVLSAAWMRRLLVTETATAAPVAAGHAPSAG